MTLRRTLRISTVLGVALAAAPALLADTYVVTSKGSGNIGLPIHTDGDGNATTGANPFTKSTGAVETTPSGLKVFAGKMFGAGGAGGLKPAVREVTPTSTGMKDFSDNILAQFEGIAAAPCDLLLARKKLKSAMGSLGNLKAHADALLKAKKLSKKNHKSVVKSLDKAAKEGAKAVKALDILIDSPPKDPTSKLVLQSGAVQDMKKALGKTQKAFTAMLTSPAF